MPKLPPNDIDPTDPALEKLVERAMQDCGWLLPTTIEGVRRAEAELLERHVPLPERLRDPHRLLDRRVLSEPKAVPSSTPVASTDPWKALPIALIELAREVGLTIEQSLKLLKMGRQVVAHRSSTKKDEMDLADWRKFYEAVKEFL
ncbi:hypothetical protein [Paludisphaera mucosa]|uniref:DUF4145 domain-containing protein n=1 Tax=Paludisphaera mucosa TaxID=3030827 RepID=A0ABT6FLE3_9BACT|nr:hypothetical protein [Paludisphaera mucosa]MDG3008392.1 hypothetical protein [Paludisphaera mucosa]